MFPKSVPDMTECDRIRTKIEAINGSWAMKFARKTIYIMRKKKKKFWGRPKSNTTLLLLLEKWWSGKGEIMQWRYSMGIYKGKSSLSYMYKKI